LAQAGAQTPHALRGWTAAQTVKSRASAARVCGRHEFGLGRADALDHARQTSQNLVSIVSTDLERNVEMYDLSLKAMVDGTFDHARFVGVSGALRGARRRAARRDPHVP
jgi:hypothetical protein